MRLGDAIAKQLAPTALVVAALIAVTVNDTLGADAFAAGSSSTNPCEVADSFAVNGEAKAARAAYLKVLRKRPLALCANQGLRALNKEAASGKQAELVAKCGAAKRLDRAGETDGSKALYVEVLKASDEECARDGLSGLGAPLHGAKSWLSAVTGFLALAAGFGFIALAAACLLFVLVTYLALGRRAIKRIPRLKKTFEPRLRVAELTNGSTATSGAPGITALVRIRLEELAAAATAGRRPYRLDRITGTEALGDALKGLSDVAPQFKALSALLVVTPQLARLPRYALAGTLQDVGSHGGGIALSLDEQHGKAFSTVIWSDAKDTGAGTYQALAAGAAAWADFNVKKNEGLKLPNLTFSASSFAYLRLGAEYMKLGLHTEAGEAFRKSAVADPSNAGALLNLSLAHAREGEFTVARDVLRRARQVLEVGP